MNSNKRRTIARYCAVGLNVLPRALRLPLAQRFSQVLVLGFSLQGEARAATVLAVRIWPARDYTRVTIEVDEALRFSYRLIENPPRLVLDLEGIAVDSALRDLVAKVRSDDPYITSVRVGQFQPGVMRLVFDLKTPVAPQLYKLDPVAQYKYRLLLDLYPQQSPDPLQELLAQMQTARPDPIGDLLRQAQEREAKTAGPASGQDTTAKADTKLPADRTGTDKPAAQRPSTLRMITVALDPGHGGEDPGAIGAAGTREKDVVLAVAFKLRERLLELPNVRVLLTRDGDYFVPLATRVEKARAVKADLFVSIHADAFERRSARGASVYVLSEKGASSAAARWIANKENQADSVGGVSINHRNREVASMLMALSTAAQIKDSLILGKAVLSDLGEVGRLHKQDIEQAGFAVLKAPDIPSILVETAFISNPEEEKRLADVRYQRSVASAIFRGITRYLKASGLRKVV